MLPNCGRCIDHHNRKYYVDAAPEISDREFDKLLDELKQIEAEHPDLVTPDSPTQRVGGAPIDEFKSVRHRHPMLSIDNTYNADELPRRFRQEHPQIAQRRGRDVRRRTQDRRRGNFAHLRGWIADSRSHPRRRRARRRCHAQPPSDARGAVEAAREVPAEAAGSPRRNLHGTIGFSKAEQGGRGRE